MLIQTEAIGVGGVDAAIRRGMMGVGFGVGMIPGSEVVGTVTAVGAEVDPSWIGRRVWAFTGTTGGYAEQAVAHVGELIALPEELSSIQAVTLGSAATVAHFALAHAHLVKGESVLIRGAAGSIGIATVQHAARMGVSAIAVTTSSVERGSRLKGFGATDVLDRAGHGGSGAPSNFDVIIDIVGGAAVPSFIDRLTPNGRMVLVGAVAGFPPADFGLRLMETFQQSRSVATFSLASIPVAERDAARASQFEAAVRGELHPVVHAVLPLDQAGEAHRQMDLSQVFGRIVLTP
ncbi:zinc-binding dehydrogenase [Nocardioides sp. W7]|uniref:zinc-binding dehydrogenase n=1 Tax=Nocardioides sp. W7 TaxID=2931390 RepID=UPI001FD10659|nr:zinc-binding dehydrogenase [Nocardioides sp. W7]